eukprot:jgi/Astpho2/6931/Aster-01796
MHKTLLPQSGCKGQLSAPGAAQHRGSLLNRPLRQPCRSTHQPQWQVARLSRQQAIRVAHAASTESPSVDEALEDAAKKADKGADGLQQSVQDAIENAKSALSNSFDSPLPEGPVGKYEEAELSDELKGEIIRVPSNFEARPGLQLTEDLVVGKELGEGVQGRVFCLDRPDGEGTTQLLKAGHSLSPSVMKYKTLTPVTGIDVGMQREWLIGQQLNTLKGEDGKLHGFMATGAAIIQEDDMLVGLLIERVNGWPVEKRLTKDESFTDINYLLECLRQAQLLTQWCAAALAQLRRLPGEQEVSHAELEQVFSYLDRAYNEIGFTHGDLMTGNIMEHRTEARTFLPKGFVDEENTMTGLVDQENNVFKLADDDAPRELEFRLLDYGHARLNRSKALQQLPKAHNFEKIGYRQIWKNKGDVWRLLQDVAVIIDGRTWNARDEPEVRLLIGLLRKVTGVTVAAFFRSDKVGAIRYSGKQAEMPWHQSGGFGHDIRMWRMRFWAFSFERNTKILPGEALQWLNDKEEYYQQKYAGARPSSAK